MKSEQGTLKKKKLKNGNVKYQVEIMHKGLHKHKIVSADDRYFLSQKAELEMAKWDRMWEALQKKEAKVAIIQAHKDLAEKRTIDARKALKKLDDILAYTLQVNDAIDWESLKKHEEYYRQKPSYPSIPIEPRKDDAKYQINLNLFDKLISSRRLNKKRKAEDDFKFDHKKWENKKQKLESEYLKALDKWNEEKKAYDKERKAINDAVELQKQTYLRGDNEQAISDYCDLVLSNSNYPDYFPQTFDLDFNLSTKVLVINYQLPSISKLPTLKEVRFIQSRNELTEKHISQIQLNKIYDNLLYQIVLRSIHEIFEADQINSVASVVFNGYVDSINPATGHEVNACILSMQVNREEFEDINLASINLKACFKKLKGVSASKLSTLTPVAPLIKIDKDDSRFVSSYNVAADIQGENLAAMDWEDFEHLIREIFEKEFASTGGEVKVTQASRDGGIDAVVFDPDPLRGGKIVVQAKRYTNTVSVSAVRDLYGTLINEGANKGILVTTADYGPDAHEFARGKPITLLSGSELLYLLEKHGHKSRIDLKEAKKILSDKK